MRLKISYTQTYQDGNAGMVDIPATCTVRYTRVENKVMWDEETVPHELTQEALKAALQMELKETLVQGANEHEFKIAPDIRVLSAYEFVCADGNVALLPCMVAVTFGYNSKPVKIEGRECSYVKEAGVFVTGGGMFRLTF